MNLPDAIRRIRKQNQRAHAWTARMDALTSQNARFRADLDAALLRARAEQAEAARTCDVADWTPDALAWLWHDVCAGEPSEMPGEDDPR